MREAAAAEGGRRLQDVARGRRRRPLVAGYCGRRRRPLVVTGGARPHFQPRKRHPRVQFLVRETSSIRSREVDFLSKILTKSAKKKFTRTAKRLSTRRANMGVCRTSFLERLAKSPSSMGRRTQNWSQKMHQKLCYKMDCHPDVTEFVRKKSTFGVHL